MRWLISVVALTLATTVLPAFTAPISTSSVTPFHDAGFDGPRAMTKARPHGSDEAPALRVRRSRRSAKRQQHFAAHLDKRDGAADALLKDGLPLVEKIPWWKTAGTAIMNGAKKITKAPKAVFHGFFGLEDGDSMGMKAKKIVSGMIGFHPDDSAKEVIKKSAAQGAGAAVGITAAAGVYEIVTGKSSNAPVVNTTAPVKAPASSTSSYAASPSSTSANFDTSPLPADSPAESTQQQLSKRGIPFIGKLLIGLGATVAASDGTVSLIQHLEKGHKPKPAPPASNPVVAAPSYSSGAGASSMYASAAPSSGSSRSQSSSSSSSSSASGTSQSTGTLDSYSGTAVAAPSNAATDATLYAVPSSPSADANSAEYTYSVPASTTGSAQTTSSHTGKKKSTSMSSSSSDSQSVSSASYTDSDPSTAGTVDSVESTYSVPAATTGSTQSTSSQTGKKKSKSVSSASSQSASSGTSESDSSTTSDPSASYTTVARRWLSAAYFKREETDFIPVDFPLRSYQARSWHILG